MSEKSFKIFVVRPYAPRIRDKVFPALECIGGVFPDGWKTDRETNDKEVVKRLQDIRPDVLLIPFNSLMLKDKTQVDGLKTVNHLYEQCQWTYRVPVVMPVSVFGMGSFVLDFPEFEKKYPDHRVLKLEEEQIFGPGLGNLLRQHVAKTQL